MPDYRGLRIINKICLSRKKKKIGHGARFCNARL
jgi:hypothetical protein